MWTERRILNSSGYGVIEFDVTGSAVVHRSYECRNQVNKIRDQVAVELGLDNPKLIEIELKMNKKHVMETRKVAICINDKYVLIVVS